MVVFVKTTSFHHQSKVLLLQWEGRRGFKVVNSKTVTNCCVIWWKESEKNRKLCRQVR